MQVSFWMVDGLDTTLRLHSIQIITYRERKGRHLIQSDKKCGGYIIIDDGHIKMIKNIKTDIIDFPVVCSGWRAGRGVAAKCTLISIEFRGTFYGLSSMFPPSRDSSERFIYRHKSQLISNGAQYKTCVTFFITPFSFSSSDDARHGLGEIC